MNAIPYGGGNLVEDFDLRLLASIQTALLYVIGKHIADRHACRSRNVLLKLLVCICRQNARFYFKLDADFHL
ncbi:MAG: hypothetical protein IKR81_02515, partial [Victivallales bacterium]|nr:hypothetical protein [Victivallales bacterium]